MISLNVLGQPQPNVPELLDWCAVAKPPYIVVMDSIDIATRIGMVSPTTQIIFRRYRPDDAELASKVKPADFLDSVADVPLAWMVQAGNEPGGDQVLLAAWCAALIRQADAIGRRVVLPNWSVGNPDDEMIAAGTYDLLLQALATGQQHRLGVHEYLFDKPLEEPWFVGRYRAFLRRADALGIARPRIVVTEHGRDLGGGADGWRAQGWSEADYARRLDEAQTVYQADGVTACVFSFGAGFDQRWQTYNVSGAPELLARMAAMNTGDDDMAGPPGWKRVKTNQPGIAVNLRATPSLSGVRVGSVKTDDWLKPTGAPVQADGHRWQRVNTEDCRSGYVSLNVLTLE